jgi:hypothetical protein
MYFNQWSSEGTEERFKVKVLPDPLTGCHNWIGSLKSTGYGYIRHNGKRTMAHRVAMMLAGHDLKDHHVLHKCNNPRCVNTEHLYLGDHAKNMRDMAEAGSNKGLNHGMSKLSEEDVNHLFEQRYSHGRRVKDVAAELGITPKTATELLGARKREYITKSLKLKYTEEK